MAQAKTPSVHLRVFFVDEKMRDPSLPAYRQAGAQDDEITEIPTHVDNCNANIIKNSKTTLLHVS
jgi:hypothetical protein